MQENLNERVEEKVDDIDYLAAIKELKENSVSKEKYDKLLKEHKEAINTLINGGEYKVEEEAQEVDIQELRNKVFNNPDQTNLDYITNALKLREELMARGLEDPFVPQGEKIVASPADREKAERVATVLQEMVDISEGDPNVFLNEYQRRVKDTSIKKR